MSTFLRTTIVAGLLLLLAGPAQALVGTNLGTLGVDPLLDGQYQSFGAWHTVEGGGSDIGGTDDHGYFAYEEFAGDGAMIIQVFDLAPASDYLRKGGLMIRDSLDEDAINVFNSILAATQGADRRGQLQTRTATGGGTSVDAAPAGNRGLQPWIKLERNGNVFTASYSQNGAVWDTYADVDVPMDGTIFLGLAVTSHDNSETAQVTFRSLSVTGFSAPGALTWNESGDNFWDTANWDTPPPSSPDRATAAILADTNTDTVTVRTAAEALTLDVLGGEIVIDGGSSLTVFGTANFDTDTYLEMDAGASLAVFGGVIPNMFADKGDVTVATAADLVVSNLDGHGIIAGTFTKEGEGKLQLDNSSGMSVFANTTTFDVQQGVLASAGADPLGSAIGVSLAGGTKLELANNPGGISTATDVTVDGSAEVNVNTTDGAYLGPLTLNDDLKTSGGGLGLSFDGTSIPASAVTIYTDIATGLGVLTAPGTQITKDGPDGLGVLSGGDVTGATFDVKAGTLMGVAMSNPFQDANEVVLSGGRLLLANNSGATAVVDTAVRLTADSELDAGADGWPFAGPPNVTLGGTNGITLDDNRLYVGTTDGYTLEIAGAIADTSGEIRMTDGTVNITGGGGGSSTDLRVVGSGIVTVSTTLLTLDDMRMRGPGTLSVAGEVDVKDNLEADEGLLVTSAMLTAEDFLVRGGVVTAGAEVRVTDDLTVESGSMTTSGVLTVESDMRISGGALNMVATAYGEDDVEISGGLVSATELVISDSLKQGANTYRIDSGTFTARGPDLLNAVDLEFGGNTLTVSGPPSDTVADSSGNGYDGDRHGGSFTGDVPAVLAGGRAMDFNGNGYAIVDTGGSQDVFDLDQMTVAFWQKEWPDGNWEPMVSKRGESGQGWQLRRRGGSSDNMTLTMRGTSDEDNEAKDAWVKDGGWHHVVATYDGATRHVYIDGGLWDSDPVTGTVNDTGAALVFAARNNSDSDLGNIGNHSNVLLDEIHIYDRAITQEEVDALVANSGISTNGLLGKWSFEDVTPVLDLPDTNLLVTSNATLEAMAGETVTFGDLEVAGGVELDLVTEAPYGMSFDDVTTGDGVSILGNMSVRGDLSVGDSPGGLLVGGNLALGDGSVYMWDLEAGGADLITVTGDLDILSAWKLQIQTGEPFVPGEHKLFTYGGDLYFDAPAEFLFSQEAWDQGWRDYGVLRVFNRGGDVMLDVVPEPATWILLLTAGVAGLIGVARRRRRA